LLEAGLLHLHATPDLLAWGLLTALKHHLLHLLLPVHRLQLLAFSQLATLLLDLLQLLAPQGVLLDSLRLLATLLFGLLLSLAAQGVLLGALGLLAMLQFGLLLPLAAQGVLLRALELFRLLPRSVRRLSRVRGRRHRARRAGRCLGGGRRDGRGGVMRGPRL